MATMGENLKRIREASSKTLPELSFDTRIQEQVLRSWENGTKPSDTGKLMRVVEALGTTLEEILGDDE